MSKTVDGIVRGPRPHFRDGVLYAPGQVVRDVPAEEVSDEAYREVEVEIEARNGELRTRMIQKPIKFRPVGGAATVTSPMTTADIATGNPDRLNVTEFLKGSAGDIEAAIMSGKVDVHLGAIEQAEIAAKGPPRKGVKEAIAARRSAISA